MEEAARRGGARRRRARAARRRRPPGAAARSRRAPAAHGILRRESDRWLPGRRVREALHVKGGVRRRSIRRRPCSQQTVIPSSTAIDPRASRAARALAWLPTVLLALALAAALAVPARAATGGAGQFEEAPEAGGAGRGTAGPGRQHAVRPPGDVDLVRLALRGRQRRPASSPAPAGTTSAPSTSSPATAAAIWNQFNRALVRRLHHGGLDVCAWQFVYGKQPVAEAKVGATLGQARRRLPGDRRRGRLRGPLRRRRPLHPRPARPDRRRLPALARRLPLRRLPPGLPLLGLPRPRRRPVQPAADVLEDDRRLGADDLRPHLRLQPALGAADLPARPDLRRPRQRRACGSSAATPPATAAARRAGGPGRRRAARSGARSAPTPATGR